MRKNHLMKLFALILSIIMVCGIATSALANEPDPISSDPAQSTSSAGVAVLNNLCTVGESYESLTETANTANAEGGTASKLVLTVNNTGDSLPPVFVYKLPDRVQNADNGSDSKVGIKWSFDENKRQLIFSWIESGKVQDSFTVKIDVVLGGFDLYNMAVIKINGTDKWYHLAKTIVYADKPYNEYPKTIVDDGYCKAAPYDFSTTKFVYNGKEYVYCGNENDLESLLNDSKPYYTVEFIEYQTSKRITDTKLVSENLWMLPEGMEPYSDNNETGGYHRNYRITLNDTENFEKQPLFNFLKGKDNNYYRLKKTEIYTTPISTYTSGQRLTEGTYYVLDGGYDFSDLVLTFDNKEYRYSDKVIKEGKYDNYYTIEPGDLLAKNVFHGKANWFFDEKGWIDGAKETYTAEELKSNNYWGFHQDYIAKFYNGNATFYSVNMYDGEEKITTARIMKGSAAELQEPEKEGYRFIGWKTEDGTDYDMATPVTGNINLIAEWESSEPAKQVTISSNWPEGKIAYPNAEITLTAELIGFGDNVTLTWEHSTNGEDWIPEPNEHGITMTYYLNEENAGYYWRVVAED